VTGPVRVVVVDDHEIVRAGLAALLGREPDIEVVALVGDGAQALRAVATLRPDVAVVDYRLPGMTGVEVCERLHAEHPAVAVIMLTTFLDDDVVRGALQAGARAYVYKDVDARELKTAIRAVARGEAVLDPKVAGRVAVWAQRRHDTRTTALSVRETEVLRLVARGAHNKDISAELHLSDNTVRTYLRRILTKLDCQSRVEAAALATQRGLL
jgi:DNA-binding NarL/FixJ family response regulator